MSGAGSIFGKLLADWDHVEHTVSEDFRWFGEAAENLVHGHPYPDAAQAPDDDESLRHLNPAIGRTVSGDAVRAALATQAPAVMPVNVGTATTLEEPMSLLDTLKTHVAADLAEVEGKLKDVDEEALAILNRVMANPETASVLKDLDGLASAVGIPAGTISGVAGGLKTVLSLYADDPAAPAPVAAAAAAQ